MLLSVDGRKYGLNERRAWLTSLTLRTFLLYSASTCGVLGWLSKKQNKNAQRGSVYTVLRNSNLFICASRQVHLIDLIEVFCFLNNICKRDPQKTS